MVNSSRIAYILYIPFSGVMTTRTIINVSVKIRNMEARVSKLRQTKVKLSNSSGSR